MKRLILLILVLILSSSFVLSHGSCTVVTESSCVDGIEVIKLSDLENAHAGLVDESDYNYVVCCDVSNPNFEVTYSDSFIFELSHTTNAHVQQYTGDYLYPIGFINSESGNSWEYCSVKLRGECDYLEEGDEFCIFSLFDLTNSHVSRCDDSWYQYVVCCDGTATGPVGESYCGDGTRQWPNDVGTGGPNNDGYEDCDDSDLLYCPDYEDWEIIDCASNCICLYEDPNLPGGWISAFVQSDCVACEGSTYSPPGYTGSGTVNCDLGGGYYNSTIYSYFEEECTLSSCMMLSPPANCVDYCDVIDEINACFIDKEEDVPFFDWFSVVLTLGLLVSYYYNKKRKSL